MSGHTVQYIVCANRSFEWITVPRGINYNSYYCSDQEKVK